MISVGMVRGTSLKRIGDHPPSSLVLIDHRLLWFSLWECFRLSILLRNAKPNSLLSTELMDRIPFDGYDLKFEPDDKSRVRALCYWRNTAKTEAESESTTSWNKNFFKALYKAPICSSFAFLSKTFQHSSVLSVRIFIIFLLFIFHIINSQNLSLRHFPVGSAWLLLKVWIIKHSFYLIEKAS